MKDETITALPEETLEHDIVVRMPPKKRLTKRVRIKSIKKATPHIVEPVETK
nr:hypothetical protein [Candidatus Freyarchaeota archaeon]